MKRSSSKLKLGSISSKCQLRLLHLNRSRLYHHTNVNETQPKFKRSTRYSNQSRLSSRLTRPSSQSRAGPRSSVDRLQLRRLSASQPFHHIFARRLMLGPLNPSSTDHIAHTVTTTMPARLWGSSNWPSPSQCQSWRRWVIEANAGQDANLPKLRLVRRWRGGKVTFHSTTRFIKHHGVCRMLKIIGITLVTPKA